MCFLPVLIAGSLFVRFERRPIGRDEIFSELQEMFDDSFSLRSRPLTISSSWSRFSVWHIKLKHILYLCCRLKVTVEGPTSNSHFILTRPKGRLVSVENRPVVFV